MTQINRICGNNGIGPVRPDSRLPSPASSPGGTRPLDRVEISEAAQLLSKMAELPEIRMEKVEQVRQAILRGDYETPDKIDVVVDRILQDLSLDLEG